MTTTTPETPHLTSSSAREVAPSTIATELAALLPAGAVLTDPDVMAGMSREQAAWAPCGEPAAVDRATCTDDVVQVVRACPRTGRRLRVASWQSQGGTRNRDDWLRPPKGPD